MNLVFGPDYNRVVQGCEKHEDFGIFASVIVESTSQLGCPRERFSVIKSGSSQNIGYFYG